MTKQVRGRLGFTDEREFGLIGYRSGHSYVLVRGFPSSAEIEESDGSGQFRMLDVCFAGVERVSCWRSIGRIHLRHPTDTERAALIARIGSVRGANLYLLRPDSIEDYVVANRVYWAEFGLALEASSPLVSDDAEYRETHPPIGGAIQFAD